MSNIWILISTPLHIKRSEKCNQTSPLLRSIKTSPSVRRIQTSSMSCKYSTGKTYSTRDIGTQTVCKCYLESSALLSDYKKTFLSPSGIEAATDVLCHNISVALPTLLSTMVVVMVKSESCIRNQKYAISYSFILSASMVVTTVLACTQMIQYRPASKKRVSKKIRLKLLKN